MTDESTLEILRKYSRLMNDAPETRSVLAKDEDLASFLFRTLTTTGEIAIARLALEIVWELITYTGNRTKSVLSVDPNSKKNFTELKQKFANDANILFLCESIVDELFPGDRVPVKPSNDSNSDSNTQVGRSRIPRMLAASSRQQLKTLIFESEDFANQDTKSAVEKSLVKVKGVVSIYFDSSASKIRRCIIRVTIVITPQTIANAILTTGCLSCVHHVSKDDYGNEILTLYQADKEQGRAVGKNSSPLPAYLNEDEYTNDVVIGDRAVTIFGDKESTKKGGGWFSGVSSFFSKTLYW